MSTYHLTADITQYSTLMLLSTACEVTPYGHLGRNEGVIILILLLIIILILINFLLKVFSRLIRPIYRVCTGQSRLAQKRFHAPFHISVWYSTLDSQTT